jgi:hypothetical protein
MMRREGQPSIVGLLFAISPEMFKSRPTCRKGARQKRFQSSPALFVAFEQGEMGIA